MYKIYGDRERERERERERRKGMNIIRIRNGQLEKQITINLEKKTNELNGFWPFLNEATDNH